ncbi:MAG: alpha/beta hydrolase fold domain-containing protein [Moraxellaceae bacterium]
MKRHSLLFILSLLLSNVAMASDFFTDFPQHRYRVVTTTYTPSAWPQALKGDLWLPTAVASSPRPVVLLVHGGSWKSGGRGDMSRIARALVLAGYAAFSIDYRLAPTFRHPAQLQDLQQAMRWLQAHAGAQGLDMQRTAAWGFSAGAHLVSLLAVQPSSDVPPLQVVVAGGTPADLRIYPDSPAVKALLGADLASAPALYAEASPLAHVRAGLPAFFLYHGTDDDLVIPDQARNMAASLEAKQVPVELFWQPGYGHIRSALFLGKSVPAALSFMAEHLAGPPLSQR